MGAQQSSTQRCVTVCRRTHAAYDDDDDNEADHFYYEAIDSARREHASRLQRRGRADVEQLIGADVFSR